MTEFAEFTGTLALFTGLIRKLFCSDEGWLPRDMMSHKPLRSTQQRGHGLHVHLLFITSLLNGCMMRSDLLGNASDHWILLEATVVTGLAEGQRDNPGAGA
jgi:hypothetical protein